MVSADLVSLMGTCSVQDDVGASSTNRGIEENRATAPRFSTAVMAAPSMG